MLTAELQTCIENCIACAEECRRFGKICEDEGDSILAATCFGCANHCDRCIAVMNDGSNSHCAHCAEICRKCAHACEESFDPEAATCAKVCKNCAEACRQSAETSPIK